MQDNTPDVFTNGPQNSISTPENTEPSPCVELSDVSLTYSSGGAELAALTNINVTINDGECVCLLGPSGCGKSTLLNLIAGFLMPSTGQVMIDGREVTGPGADRGMVFQEPTLYDWLDVSDNIAFGLKMRHAPAEEIRHKTAQLLSLTGLEEFAHFAPYELSGGMRQRVSLARILAGGPRVLLMDEPFSALDPATRQEMQDLLLRLQCESHCTGVLVTHDINEALFLADRILVFSARPGRIIDEISLREVSFTDRRSEIIERPDMTALHKRIITAVTNA